MQKPRTIAQYCIQKWLDANFYANELKIEFVDTETAKITDRNGESAYLVYENGNVFLKAETPGAATPRESR